MSALGGNRSRMEVGGVVAEAAAVAEGGVTAKVGLLIQSYEATLQDLLDQIITYWKVLPQPACPTSFHPY